MNIQCAEINFHSVKDGSKMADRIALVNATMGEAKGRTLLCSICGKQTAKIQSSAN